jgi:uncharacterized repeat protein (TIGR01451 family)
MRAFRQTVAEQALPFQQADGQFVLQAHGLRFSWDERGLAASADTQPSPWQWNLRLTAYGRSAQILPLPAPRFLPQSHQIIYHYLGLTEWHRNTSLGLEQGFTLASPPDGEGDLLLRFALTTPLPASLSADRRSLRFSLPNGQMLSYSGLRAYDSAGRELNAWLEYLPHQITIHVDDRGATYPLTIDPLIYVESKLTDPMGNANDEFGAAVALWGDTAVIGTRLGDAPGGSDQGAAYVFRYSETMGWTLEQKLVASDGKPGDRFGFSVAIWENMVVIGAYQATVNSIPSCGAAYVFVRENGTWRQTQKLIAFDRKQGAMFGYSVAIRDGILAIGAPGMIRTVAGQGAVYVYTLSDTRWGLQQKLVANDGNAYDYFGSSVAVGNNIILIGAPYDDNNAIADQGSAYIFTWTNQWVQQQKLTATDGAAGDKFGTSVALDGDMAFIGAPEADIAGKADQGAVYPFTRSLSGWTEQPKITSSDGASTDAFGTTMAVHGGLLAVGARFADISSNVDAGAIYLYFMDTSGLWQNEQKISASTAAAGENFGNAVALFGGDLIAGARLAKVGENTAQGAAYAYTLYRNDTDLALTANATSTRLSPGEPVTITVEVRNNSNTAANDVRVPIAFPANLTYSISNATQGSYDPSRGAWLLGTLADNSSATLTINATASADAAGSAKTFLANLLSRDLDDSNNSARLDFHVVLFTLSPDTLSFDDQLIFSTSPLQTVQVTNVSGKTVTIGTLTASTGFLLANNTCNGQTLANAASCSFGVRFNPVASIVYDGAVEIPVSGSNYITTLPLHGVGLDGTELLTNFSFEKDVNRDRVPDDWKKASAWTLNDGRNCTVKRTGACSLRFTGTSGLKSLQYVVLKSGVAGDDFLLTVWSRASTVPSTAKYYRIRLEIYNGTTLVGSKTFNFAKGTHAFVQGRLPLTAAADYTKIIVKIEFQAASGTVWFDDASLRWAP